LGDAEDIHFGDMGTSIIHTSTTMNDAKAFDPVDFASGELKLMDSGGRTPYIKASLAAHASRVPFSVVNYLSPS
jgi:hypothetical protein